MATFSNGYSYRRLITIDHTKVGGALTNFPAYYGGTFSYLADVNQGGNVHNNTQLDIRFETTSGTKLSHEIITRTTSGVISAWVKLPSVSNSTDTTFYIYYGKDLTVSEEDAVGVWAAYHGVWHLGGNPGLIDSEHPTSSASQVGTVALSNTSPVGTGYEFDNSVSDYLTIPNSSTYKFAYPIFMSAWIKVNNTTDYNCIASTDSQIGRYYGSQLRVTTGGALEVQNGNGGIAGPGARKNVTTSSTPIAGGTWYLVHALILLYDTVAFSVNGVTQGTNAATGSSTTTTATYSTAGSFIGLESAGDGSPMNGIISEYRLSHVNPGTAWIETEYANQSSPSTFYSIGPELSVKTDSASVSGDSTVAGTAILKLTALSTVSGDAIASSSITRMLFLEASESGDSSALSDIIDMGGDPTASVLGDSIASLTAIAEILFSGSSSGDSTVDADIVLLEELEASISGGSTVSSGATVIFAVISSVYGDSTVVAYTYVGPFLPPSYTPGGDIGFEGRVTPTGTLLEGSDGLSGGLEARIKGSVDMQAAEEVEVGSFELP